MLFIISNQCRKPSKSTSRRADTYLRLLSLTTAEWSAFSIVTMKSPLFLLAFLFTESLFSQPIISPDVHSDGRVTFRLKAPNAETVRVQCEGLKSTNMKKDAQGVRSFTSEPME